MSGFDVYGSTAGNIANQYGLDPAVFFGLVQVESGWNPTAKNPGSSAYGFTQLLSGTASDLGVNRFDPVQNLKGGASYLSQQLKRFGGDYTKALAAYHDGPGAVGLHGGFDYAKKVLGAAQGFLGEGKKLLGLDAGDVANAILPGSGVVLDGLGITDGCGWLCQFQDWIKSTGFFTRLALAVLALILFFAGFYLMKGKE